MGTFGVLRRITPRSIGALLAERSGEPQRFRENEDVAFLEGKGQTLVQTALFGNTVTSPAVF